jgi:hypothetical protein
MGVLVRESVAQVTVLLIICKMEAGVWLGHAIQRRDAENAEISAEKRARGLEFEGLAEGFEFDVAAVVAGLGDR